MQPPQIPFLHHSQNEIWPTSEDADATILKLSSEQNRLRSDCVWKCKQIGYRADQRSFQSHSSSYPWFPSIDIHPSDICRIRSNTSKAEEELAGGKLPDET